MFRPGLALRLTQSAARPAGRRFASTTTVEAENEFIAKRAAMRDHAVRKYTFYRSDENNHMLVILTGLETTDLWKKISFFVCIPGIAVCALWTYKAEMAHKAHAA